ncbi:DUF5709 domain-containing protein [Amycolatopsis sp. FDAARGOS 1241]
MPPAPDDSSKPTTRTPPTPASTPPDTGIDGAAATAEEAAIHIIPE